MLYASLAASLFSAFLAMLGKQWLNRYISTNLRGTAIECSQNRQRKLNGIVSWYFEHVMESLPLMLQIALLLLGCALSQYLWGINTTIASVVLGVTSLGVIFYLFVVVAGAASESCPYQTPGSRILRLVPPAVVSAASAASTTASTAASTAASIIHSLVWHSTIVSILEDFWATLFSVGAIWSIYALCLLPVALAIDLFHLGQTMFKSLAAYACQNRPRQQAY